MSLRYVSVVFVATMLAVFAVLAASAAQPKKAEAANTATLRGCTGTNVTLTTNEKRMLDLHNKARADRGIPRLCVHPALQRAATWYAQDMVNRHYYHSDHTSYNGELAMNRVKRFGYNYRTFGENIACGSGDKGSPAYTFNNKWMTSSGHRANILNSKFREIGIGARTGDLRCDTARTGVTAWVVDFGAR